MRLGWRMRYYPAVGPAIPRASVGRSRVTHPFAGHLLRDAHDLHVLSTPPAFVLSQDQTLQEKSSKQLDSERPATISASRSHRQSRQLRHRITDYCRSNSPWHPDMDARSTSPPCTSAISSISCQTAASINSIRSRVQRQPHNVLRGCKQVNWIRRHFSTRRQRPAKASEGHPQGTNQHPRHRFHPTAADPNNPPPAARQPTSHEPATSELRRHDKPAHQVRPDGLEPSTSDLRGPCSTS
jgi:hypothetical protein